MTTPDHGKPHAKPIDEALQEFLRRYWRQYSQPVALRILSARFSRAALGYPGGFVALIDALEESGTVVVVMTASGARFLYHADTWALFTEAERESAPARLEEIKRFADAAKKRAPRAMPSAGRSPFGSFLEHRRKEGFDDSEFVPPEPMD